MRRMGRRGLVVATLTALAALPSAAQARTGSITDGQARFTVITPSLVRMEFAQDKAFEDAPTMTAPRRTASATFTTTVSKGWRVIRTAKLTLRYKRNSGAFGDTNVRLDGKVTPKPGTHNQLGGWTRALDLQTGRVPLNPGVLSKDGWYVVDDTRTVNLTAAAPGFAVRKPHSGPYQDWYLFSYGTDYARALKDLRALTGAAPLLPRSAFGVWFSKYFPYSADEFRQLADEFKQHDVPLDTLSLDTDYKRVANQAGAAVESVIVGAPTRPASWNGWDWNTDLFPDPKGFVDWAHGQGINLGLNIHPSINTNDPKYAQTVAKTGELKNDTGTCLLLQADPTGQCRTFDWTKQSHLDAYFDLHKDFADAGADFFWLDWCCEGEGSADAPGLSPDTWINQQYATEQRKRDQRWPAFSRIGAAYHPDGSDGDRTIGADGTGALAEHRNTIQFTGDTCATWEMLGFEAEVSAAAAAIGLPYVSHDIGSFNGEPFQGNCNPYTPGTLGNTVAPDLYARWVQFATFQPLDRLHSNHGKRLPWEYSGAAAETATRFLRLREQLIPYIYTLARRAHDSGLPITGPLYLTWPRSPEAYQHPMQYTFGRNVVVAPVTSADSSVTYWVPPGTWQDYFTGQTFTGPRTVTETVPLSRLPVLVKAGTILPTQPLAAHTPDAPPTTLNLTAYANAAKGSFTLYDDAGRGLGYEGRAYTRTAIRQTRTEDAITITIARPSGTFPGRPGARTYKLTIEGVDRHPTVVRTNRRRAYYTYDEAARRVTMDVVAGNAATVVVTLP